MKAARSQGEVAFVKHTCALEFFSIVPFPSWTLLTMLESSMPAKLLLSVTFYGRKVVRCIMLNIFMTQSALLQVHSEKNR
ncbi:hypothetical protein JTE90_028835 [Oedothorax gibbosus]|uniref:Uncharacterized protein n=1 Tax=Oedothorax gibbosus TaxID=931172 RepID=A0AAV6VWY7_9ARAC|nr:hypothetical protein JTE90_028835 [Oedothorax gibbosus]